MDDDVHPDLILNPLVGLALLRIRDAVRKEIRFVSHTRAMLISVYDSSRLTDIDADSIFDTRCFLPFTSSPCPLPTPHQWS